MRERKSGDFQVILDYNSIDRFAWSEFVENHPHGNIFQTPEMYDVYRKTKNYEPFVIVALSQGKIVGCLVSVIQKEYKGLLGKFTARSIVMGGPLVKDGNGEILEMLLAEYNLQISSKAIYSQFRNLYDMSSFQSNFGHMGYKYEDHLDIWIDLRQSEDELWKGVHTKRRNEVRRAEKSEVVVKMFFPSDLDEVYAILKEVYNRARIPLASKELFENAISELYDKRMICLKGAYYGEKLIGIMILLSYKNVLYDWYAGALSTYYDKHPNDILPWYTFLQAKKDGYKFFDFGGAGKPNVPYGVRDYKMKFGGKIVNLGRYEIVHKKMLMKMAVVGFEIYKKFKGKNGL